MHSCLFYGPPRKRKGPSRALLPPPHPQVSDMEESDVSEEATIYFMIPIMLRYNQQHEKTAAVLLTRVLTKVVQIKEIQTELSIPEGNQRKIVIDGVERS